MRTSLAAIAATAALAASGPAWAGDVNGYVSSRTQYSRAATDRLLPSDDLPQWDQLLEFNAQVRHGYLERAFVYGDVSAFGRIAFDYRGLDEDGREVQLDDRDPPGARPFISLNELYLSHEVRPELNLMIGKKRIVWGSGMAFNPTDLLNPPKDPTDPSLQRAGAWVAMAEVPLETMTFSFVASPAVTAQANGLPYRFLVQPEWDRDDEALHYLLIGRAYALVGDADVNLMLFYGNQHPDAFTKKLRVGGSFSRYFAEVNELHVEALVQSGSPRTYVNGACVESAPAIVGCALEDRAFAATSRLDSRELFPRVLVGGRRHFDDESLLSIEYLYQADGYSPEEVQDLVNALSLLKSARTIGVGPGGGAGTQTPGGGALTGGAEEGGIPVRFRFEPLGRHYLFATYQKPKIRNDFTVAVTALASLQDLSGLVAPSLSWSATEWLTLTASAFVPFPGPTSLAATDPDTGEAVSEYGLVPLRSRGVLEARIYY